MIKNLTLKWSGRMVVVVLSSWVLATSIWFRIRDLDWIPGINGDEAWAGVQMEDMLAGRKFLWRTPTGNPLNPLHFGPLALALIGFGPKFWVLRLPTVISTCVAIPLAYLLLRKPIGERPAIGSALLIATHPAILAYARFGWDSSHTPLASLLVIAFALRGQTLMMLISLGLGYLVHPTNVFLFPIALLVWIASGFLVSTLGITRSTTESVEHTTNINHRLSLLKRIRMVISNGWVAMYLVLLLITVSTVISVVLYLNNSAIASRFSNVFANLTNMNGWLTHLANIVGLLSGESTYEFLVGPQHGTIASWERIVTGLSLAIFFLGACEAALNRDGRLAALLFGISSALIGLLLIAGPQALRPHFERYGYFAIVPTLIGIAWSICQLCRTVTIGPQSWESLSLMILPVLATFGLISFQKRYFDVYLDTGGTLQAHRTFRTANPEPKLQAFQIIAADLDSQVGNSQPQGRVPVVCEDWWLTWPMRYLEPSVPKIKNTGNIAGRNTDLARIRCLDFDDFGDDYSANGKKLMGHILRGGYVVCFAGSHLDLSIQQSIPNSKLWSRQILDRGGQPLIQVYRIKNRSNPTSRISN